MIVHTCKQGSVISGFLFSIVKDWEKKKTVEHNNWKWWNFTAVLEDIDFANNLKIALLSSKKKHIQSWENCSTEQAQQRNWNENQNQEDKAQDIYVMPKTHLPYQLIT